MCLKLDSGDDGEELRFGKELRFVRASLLKYLPLVPPKFESWNTLLGASIYDVRKIVGFFYPLVTVTNQLILFLSSAF